MPLSVARIEMLYLALHSLNPDPECKVIKQRFTKLIKECYAMNVVTSISWLKKKYHSVAAKQVQFTFLK